MEGDVIGRRGWCRVLGCLLSVMQPDLVRAGNASALSMPWGPAEPMFGRFTTPSGRSYTLMQAIRVEGKPEFAVYYVARKRSEQYLGRAAADLFQSARLLAERLRFDRVTIAAYYQVARGEFFSHADCHVTRYVRGADAEWRRMGVERAPGFGAEPGKSEGSVPPPLEHSSVSNARAVADRWLTLLDAGKAEEAWGAGTSMFKARIPLDVWMQMAPQVRSRKGAVRERKLLTTLERSEGKDADGAPVVVFDFQVTSERGTALVERVELVQASRIWKLSGYALF